MASIMFRDRTWIKTLLLDIQTHWRLLLIILTPIVLCPLPLVVRTSGASCGYVVLIMIIFWLTEVLPLPVTGILPLALYPLFRVATAKEVSSNYSKEQIWLFFGSLLMALAVEQSQLHHRLGLFTLIKIGSSPRRLMLGFMVSTCFLSMWMANTACTAMMVPLALAVIDELMQVQPAAKTVASCNGAKEVVEAYTVENPTGAKAEEPEIQKDHSSVAEAVMARGSPRFQRMCKGLLLCICYSANIGGTGTLTGTASNIVLTGFLEKKYPGKNTGLSYATWMAFCVPQMVIILVLAWVWLQALYIGFRKDTKQQDTEAAAIKAVLMRKYKALKPMSFAEIMILILFVALILLWLSRSPGFAPGWGDYYPEGVTDGTAAMVVGFLLFIIPRELPKLASFSGGRSGSTTMAPRALLTWSCMQNEFPWGLLLLVGGGYAMADGVAKSGLDKAISEVLKKLDAIPTFGFLAITVVVVTFITEVCSNAAIAAIFIPIGATVAEHMHVNPLYVILPITIACSFAFMLPVATPPNAVVFSAGLLRVADMAMAGFVMNVICMLVLLVNANTYGYWLLQSGTYPEWAAQVANATSDMANATSV